MKTDLRPRPSEQTAAQSKSLLQPARPAPPDSPETASIHQTLTPETTGALAAQLPRPPAAAAPRHVTHAEFNTAMVHFY
ncbi:MAG TPA: hypothetical protein VF508_05260, partial [Pyrinomonadaceae bacterium]